MLPRNIMLQPSDQFMLLNRSVQPFHDVMPDRSRLFKMAGIVRFRPFLHDVMTLGIIPGPVLVPTIGKKIENGVVNGYKKIETGVVEGFTKMTDHFVDQFLTKEGETVAEAKARLAREQAQREERHREQAVPFGQRPKER